MSRRYLAIRPSTRVERANAFQSSANKLDRFLDALYERLSKVTGPSRFGNVFLLLVTNRSLGSNSTGTGIVYAPFTLQCACLCGTQQLLGAFQTLHSPRYVHGFFPAEAKKCRERGTYRYRQIERTREKDGEGKREMRLYRESKRTPDTCARCGPTVSRCRMLCLHLLFGTNVSNGTMRSHGWGSMYFGMVALPMKVCPLNNLIFAWTNLHNCEAKSTFCR